MKLKSLSAVLSLLPVVACVKPAVEAPVEAPVAALAPANPEPLPPADPPRDLVARFPAGQGVTLMADQFQALMRDSRVRDRNVAFADRLAIVEQALGKGEAIEDPLYKGFVWRGVSARTMAAPFGCQEFILSSTNIPASTRPGDHRKCGLPYSLDPSKPYAGPAPKRTAFRLEEILGEAGVLSPQAAIGHALMKLGAADVHGEGGEEMWAGIAGRGKDAPITCRLLHLGARPRIEDAPLASCNLSWPMANMTFEPGDEQPPLDKNAKLAECSTKCTSSEVCMIDQRVPMTASVRREADGDRARYQDGRAAKAELVASCVPIPSTCSNVNASCFFPTPAPGQPLPLANNTGPCPSDSYGGRSFQSTPTNHIVCYSRIGIIRPPPLAPPPMPPTRQPGNVTPYNGPPLPPALGPRASTAPKKPAPSKSEIQELF